MRKMPFTLGQRSSKKSLTPLRAPARKARLSNDDDTMKERKSFPILKKISISLDGVASTLMKDGNWCVGDDENKTESRHLLHQTQVNEKLIKENETLKRRNDILIDLAKERTEEIEKMEKELRELRRIVKKCAPKSIRRS